VLQMSLPLWDAPTGDSTIRFDEVIDYRPSM